MASSNTANWPVYSRKRKANVEELSWWFQGPKYLQFALRATRTHLTPTSYQQSRQLFIRHKLARQSKIRELLLGKKKTQKQQLREERRPLIDRDALRSVCQLQTPDGETAGVPGCRSFSKSKGILASQPGNSGIDPKNAAPQWGWSGAKLPLKSCLWNNQAATGDAWLMLGDESVPSDLFRDVWYAVIFDCFLIYAQGDWTSSYLFKTFLWHDWGCWRICNIFIHVNYNIIKVW